MSNILINLSVEKTINSFDGGKEYSLVVIRKIINENKDSKIIILKTIKTSCIDGTDIPLLINKYENIEYLINLEPTSKYLKHLIESNEISVIYDPEAYNSKHIYNLDVRKVITIHGLRNYEVVSDLYECYFTNTIKFFLKNIFIKFYKKRYLKKFINPLAKLKENDRIVVVSNHTKYTLLSLLPVLKASVLVFYSPTTKNNSRNLTIPTKDFFLIISADRWIKNSVRTLNALKYLYSQKLITIPTIVVGENRIVSTFKSENIKVLSNISDDRLDELYSKCFCLIYTSLSEGFGYPPIEVMKYGKPSLLSAVTSIPEVTGGQFIYTNPYSQIEIIARIHEASIEYSNHEKWSAICLNQHKKIVKKQSDDLKNLIKLINYEK